MSRTIAIHESFKEFVFRVLLERAYEAQQVKDHPPDIQAVKRFLKNLAKLTCNPRP